MSARLAGALICALALVAVRIVFGFVGAGEARDATALKAFLGLGRGWARALGLGSITYAQAALYAVAALVVALLRRQALAALLVAAMLGGSVAASEALKPLLAHGNPFLAPFRLGAATYPSGNATVAMAMALSAILVAPPRLRTLVAAAGGLFVVAVGLSLLSLGSHLPSQVVGGFLMAGLWGYGAIAVGAAVVARRPACSARSRLAAESALTPTRLAAAFVIGGTALALGIAVAIRSRPPGTLPEANAALVTAALLIAGVAAALVGTFAALVGHAVGPGD